MLSTQRNANVLTATLSRPPVNAIDDGLLARLNEALDQAEADASICVLHIRSDQKAFCAGADLALMQSCFATPEGPDAMVAVVRESPAERQLSFIRAHPELGSKVKRLDITAESPKPWTEETKRRLIAVGRDAADEALREHGLG